jgi:hypothetical protein
MKKVLKKTVSKKRVAAPKKAKHSHLLAEAMAGMTLLASLAGYSLYLVRHGKVDLKKVKMSVLNESKKVSKGAGKASKSLMAKVKSLRK